METDDMETGGRTVVVSGVPDVLPDHRIVDKLTIHFQSCRRSDGGDVEVVKYPTNMEGVAFVTFDRADDAERVVQKDQHIMVDDQFPSNYLLTVFPFTPDVFLYVTSAMVDLSVVRGDQTALIQTLRSTHRSLRFRPCPQQKRVTVEGPFVGVQALRQDLIRMAGGLKSQVSAQTAAVRLRETLLNPRVTSHHEAAASLSWTKAKPGPASSNRLSPLPQITGEAAAEQSQRPQRASPRFKVSHERPCIRLGDEEDDEAEPRGRSRLDPPTGVRYSPSGLDLLTAGVCGGTEKIFGVSECLKDPDQTLSADILQTRRKNVPAFCGSDSDEETASIWLDSHTLAYIKKFDKNEFDRCLRSVDASFECQGGDLTRISLAGSPKTRRIQLASDSLRSLADFWLSMLRVHRIDHNDKERLARVCEEASVLYSNVLYVVEDSGVKVVGSPMSSHLFCKRVEEKLKDT